MRVAFFSPLPPAKSGIADYSAALLDPLARLADVRVFQDRSRDFDPAQFDALLYQIGNNPHHIFTYEAALEHPGVVVVHEANLHHLIAEMTIKGGDWDAYLAEVEYNGGAEALAYARRVQALEVGPDYEGLPMLRRLLERSKAAIVHSRAVECELRKAGFRAPVGVIPHGAWIQDGDRLGYRYRLGVDESTPLIGVFGFLKPYKRIAESLRAFRRLLKLEPRAKMIFAGEAHPDLPLASMIRSLDLSASVRALGFIPIEDFNGYLSACDIVLNLRYPTVGESSGTLLRSLGLGKAVLVSDVGSFSELPDEICLKVPVDAHEEDLIFEYLNLLTTRPEVARAMGARARAWVERECNWETVAERYAAFLECVAEVREWVTPQAPAMPVAELSAEERPPAANIEPEYVSGWVQPGSEPYIERHITRLVRTLEITPPGGPSDRILEMGAYLQITPALKARLGYGGVRGCYYGPAGQTDHRRVKSVDGEEFECEVDLFNAEKDRFPYPDEHFSTVLCGELIEHLFEDPMFLLSEVNRILKPDGHLVLTTPNAASLRALAAILQGYHPGFFPAYIRPRKDDEEPEARHNREYTPREVERLLHDAGFEVTLLETGEFRDLPHPELGWVKNLLERYRLPDDLRGDGIYAVGRKIGPVRERYPSWLYN